ncbi:MAG: hypothetical protein ACOX0F_05090 [Syntrophomonadaceae bacterium]|jgi:hypothetical protein
MYKYEFEILNVKQLKGKRIEGTRDYDLKVRVSKANEVIFEETIRVRKTSNGIFPEEEIISKKIKSSALKKDIIQEIKAYIKKHKK